MIFQEYHQKHDPSKKKKSEKKRKKKVLSWNLLKSIKIFLQKTLLRELKDKLHSTEQNNKKEHYRYKMGKRPKQTSHERRQRAN